ncbi:hypothetical protein NVP1022O_48 [Vibrio phage 1.022.O._10N.286.45.A10]|nr:hypothetical protein NVP1022O_48 [Vibrio phage 1.022.O._10N.286.45.A10]
MPRRLTTEEFIEKARVTHGDKYSYERCIYITGRRKITITCPEHGDFEQRPSDHVNGDGCAKCSGKHRYTTEEFVEKALAVHDGKYSYGRSIYVTGKKKLTITCPEHGDFEQVAKDHLRGKGCTTCGGRKNISTAEFLESARRVHGDKYNYTDVRYLNNKTNVVISCPDHGSFNQRPSHHLSGIGCPSCAGNFIKTTKQFIEEAVRVHGGTYSYGRTVYASAHEKITITCPEHGDFSQTPSGHLRGKGCAKCSKVHQPTTEEFIDKARAVHGSRYGYERAVYLSNKTKLTITCPVHGDFVQDPSNHLQGKGCLKCAVTGFNPNKQAYLYVLLDTETHSRVKIGISNVPNNRLRDLKRDTPFTLERIDLFETPPGITLQIEKFCHSQMESSGLQGFNGATEWFKFDGGKLEALRAFILTTGGVRI